jgi:hypothetical protein
VVKRYEHYDKGGTGSVFDVVPASDYDALAARLAEAERHNAEMAELLLSFTTSSWLNDHHKRRINAVLMPADSATDDRFDRPIVRLNNYP